mmetsp:Transcript_45385/g.144870  ORF Transcript_45385/g.144870 Transcript_45385/m.144870 type:complete len:80 (+) Transcript_45385:1366-1605(+)
MDVQECSQTSLQCSQTSLQYVTCCPVAEHGGQIWWCNSPACSLIRDHTFDVGTAAPSLLVQAVAETLVSNLGSVIWRCW